MGVVDGNFSLNQPVRIDEAQVAVQSTQSNGIPDTLRAARNSNDKPLATVMPDSPVTENKNNLSAQLLSLLPDVPFEQTLSNLTLTELSQLALTNKDFNNRCTEYLDRKGLATSGLLRKPLASMAAQDRATVKQQTAQRKEEQMLAYNEVRELNKAQQLFDERQLWAEKMLGILEKMPIKCLRGDIQKVFDLLKKPAKERCLDDLIEARLLNENDAAVANTLSDIQKIYLLSSPALLNMMHKQPHLEAFKAIPDAYLPLSPSYIKSTGVSRSFWVAGLEKGLEKATAIYYPPEGDSNIPESETVSTKEAIVSNLIKSGLFDAEPDMLFNETFLTNAVNLGSINMVGALIKFAPKVINQENDRRQRPLDIALKQGNQAMIDLLEKAGATATPSAEEKRKQYIADLQTPVQFSSPAPFSLSAVPKKKSSMK